MTKAERLQLKEAIRLIHSAESNGGNYDKGMRILCGLAGYKVAPLPEGRAVPLWEILSKSKSSP